MRKTHLNSRKQRVEWLAFDETGEQYLGDMSQGRSLPACADEAGTLALTTGQP